DIARENSTREQWDSALSHPAPTRPGSLNTTVGKTTETFIRGDLDAEPKPTEPPRIAIRMVAPPPYYTASPARRTAASLPFGWGAVTVVLVGVGLLLIGILRILS